MMKSYGLDNIDEIEVKCTKPCIIFLYWDLGAGKTTLSQKIINRYTKQNYNITSPTYVYYNIYEDITHFDLYRLGDYDQFVSIWWEEILDNNEGLILVEWPEILEKYYKADIEIRLTKTQEENERNIEIIYK